MSYHPINKALLFFMEIGYIATVTYMMLLLKALNEKRTIVMAYTIYLLFDLTLVLFYVLASKSSDRYVSFIVISALSIIITLILAIQSLRIKKRQLIKPYSIYAFALFFVLVVKLTGTILLVMHYTRWLFKLATLFEALFPFTVLYALFKIYSYLKNEKKTEGDLSTADNHE